MEPLHLGVSRTTLLCSVGAGARREEARQRLGFTHVLPARRHPSDYQHQQVVELRERGDAVVGLLYPIPCPTQVHLSSYLEYCECSSMTSCY